MIKIAQQLSKIPRSTLIDEVGMNILQAVGEFETSLSDSDITDILIDMYGYKIFHKTSLFKKLLYTLNEKQLDHVNDLMKIQNGINDYLSFTMKIKNEKFGKNKFSECILNLFDENIDNYFNDNKYSLPSKEVIIPRFSDKEPSKNIPNMFELHNYQKRVKDEILDNIFKPKSKFLVHMPTGSGKTKTSAEAIVDFWRSRCKNTGFIIWITERKELCEQAFDTIKTTWKFKGDVSINLFRLFENISPKIDELDSGIIFIGFKKFQSIIDKIDPIFIKLRDETHLIVVDEAHRSIAKTYRSTLDSILQNNFSRMIGLTATPGRNDDEESSILSEYFSTRKINITDSKGIERDNIINYLQENKYLAKINRKLIKASERLTRTEIDEITRRNSIPKGYIERLSQNAQRNFQIINEIKVAVLQRDDPTLIFANSVEHAIILKLLLKKENITSEYILGETPPQKRSEIINNFKNNKLPVLINFQVLREGFDAPNIKTLVIARPTLSIVLYSQMLGRALRGPRMGGLSETNTIIDFDDNYRKLGSVNYAFEFFNSYYS